MKDAKKPVIVRLHPYDTLEGEDKALVDKVNAFVQANAKSYEVTNDEAKTAKSLVNRGLLFWCDDRKHVMTYKKAHE